MSDSSPRSTIIPAQFEEATVAISIRHNNRGVAHMLEAGRLEEAMKCFKLGMTSLKVIIEDYAQSKRRQTSEQSLRNRRWQPEWQRPEPVLVDAANQQEFTEGQGPCANFFVFQCPMRITNENVPFPESYAEISLILTYNLALVYFLTGMGSDDGNSEDYLRKALSLYSMALQLVSRDNSITSSAVVVSSAILNNMGIAYSLLGESELCKKYLKHMLSILMIELAASQSHQLSNHVNGFFFNVNRFIYEKSTAPAA